MAAFEELTPKALRSWLLQHGADSEVGLAREPSGCPLARWLEGSGAAQPQVMLDNISFRYEGETHSIPTPPWARNFLLAVDDLPGIGVWLVSAQRAVEILDSVLPARVA